MEPIHQFLFVINSVRIPKIYCNENGNIQNFSEIATEQLVWKPRKKCHELNN